MAWLSANPMWEAFGTRALMHATYGGADFGECRDDDRIGSATAPDLDAWHREWSALADRLGDDGDASAASTVVMWSAARQAYVRAATYHRTALRTVSVRRRAMSGSPPARPLRARERCARVDGRSVRSRARNWLEIAIRGRVTLPGVFVRARRSRRTLSHGRRSSTRTATTARSDRDVRGACPRCRRPRLPRAALSTGPGRAVA